MILIHGRYCKAGLKKNRFLPVVNVTNQDAFSALIAYHQHYGQQAFS
jgi:hypothetical protein